MTAIVTAMLAGISIYLLLYVVISYYLVSNESMEMRLRAVENITQQRRTDAEIVMTKSFSQRILVPLAEKFVIFKALSPVEFTRLVEKRLLMAGGLAGLSAEQLIAISGGAAASLMVASILGSFLFKYALKKTLLMGFYSVVIGLFYPYLLLTRKITARQASIQRDLPDVLDMMTVSVEAGLSFDGALAKLSEKMKGALVDEFNRVLQEMRMGVSRKDALKAMSNRCGNKELSLFVSALVQADQLGVSIGNVLRIQAGAIRTQRSQQIEKKAMKAPVQMLFPLVFCIFPSLFVVLLGPAMIKIMTSFIKR